MASIPQRVLDRFKETIPRFQKILTAAKNRDINEADTVTIVSDILVYVFGFDKYVELTGEYVIRNTYCDLAVKLGDKVQYLVEVKVIGTDLKEGHLKQAIDYGANEGIQWVVLTNGVIWDVYRIIFEQPVGREKICSINLLEMAPRSPEEPVRSQVQANYRLCREFGQVQWFGISSGRIAGFLRRCRRWWPSTNQMGH